MFSFQLPKYSPSCCNGGPRARKSNIRNSRRQSKLRAGPGWWNRAIVAERPINQPRRKVHLFKCSGLQFRRVLPHTPDPWPSSRAPFARHSSSKVVLQLVFVVTHCNFLFLRYTFVISTLVRLIETFVRCLSWYWFLIGIVINGSKVIVSRIFLKIKISLILSDKHIKNLFPRNQSREGGGDFLLPLRFRDWQSAPRGSLWTPWSSLVLEDSDHCMAKLPVVDQR